MSRKEKISEPPEAIEKIISVVRLLPVAAELKSYHDSYFQRIHNDPDKLFSSLWEEYEIEDEDAENYYLRDLEEDDFDDEDDEDRRADPRTNYRREKERAEDQYKRKALEECLLGLSDEFAAYVRSPEPASLESLHEQFEERLTRPMFSFQEFVHILNDKMIENLVSQRLFSAIQRYRNARENHARLYNLVAYLEAYRLDRYEHPYYPEKRKLFEIKDINVVDGKLRFLPDEFTEAFNGVDIDRIKLCGSCKKVFWVKRLDMKGCTTSCAKILRTRKWREKTTKEQRLKYKINRIQKDETKGAK
jgi:hypothetical protein